MIGFICHNAAPCLQGKWRFMPAELNQNLVTNYWPKQTLISILAFLVLIVCGCASSLKSVTNLEREAFLDGKIQFDCLSCAGIFGQNLHEMEKRYQNSAWNRLSELVIGAGFGSDLSYYYLGRAAEGLGKNNAARIYYQRGLVTNLKCNPPLTFINGCLGHTFPEEFQTRLSYLEKGNLLVAPVSESELKNKSSQVNIGISPDIIQCRTNLDCGEGYSCRAKSGGGSECRHDQSAGDLQGATPIKLDNQAPIPTQSLITNPSIDNAKQKCAELGYQEHTQKFGKCVLEVSK